MGIETDPAAAATAVGASLRSLSPADATSILEALSAQAAALSLVLAADAGGAIRLPESLRHLVESASVLPAFLGGAAN
jgi:predicted TIM-barrel enzyme